MKAEHRKELQTNILADRMGRLMQNVTGNTSPTSIMLWVFAGLALGTFVAWYWAGSPSEANADLWEKLDKASFNKPENYFEIQSEVTNELDQITKDSRYTIPGRTARFQKARYLLSQGLKNLPSTFFHDKAVDWLLQARKLFAELVLESSDVPVLAQEAMMGEAKAEEALMGTPDGNNAEKTYGTIDRTLELYRRLQDAYPKSYLGELAAKRVDELNKESTDVKKFYTDLNKQATSKQAAP